MFSMSGDARVTLAALFVVPFVAFFVDSFAGGFVLAIRPP
jgi:hypothetical protein